MDEGEYKTVALLGDFYSPGREQADLRGVCFRFKIMCFHHHPVGMPQTLPCR